MPDSVVLQQVADLIHRLSDPMIGIPVVIAVALLSILIPFILDPNGFRKYPGPLPAALSKLWLARQAGRGNRYEVVHDQHQKYGKFVRIAPDHVSIADHTAINEIYGHGNGFLKTEFYDAFVSIRRGLFNTRDRAEHTRKRKIVSHVFSMKNVNSFEPHIATAMVEMFKQWDAMCEKAAKYPGMDGNSAKGRAVFDILNWFNYFAFDVISTLAFGKSFGMIKAAKDIAPVRLEGSNETLYLPAIQILNDRGEYSATLGVLPMWMRPLAKKLPWFSRGVKSVKNLAGIAIAAVGERLENPSDQDDLLSKLQAGKDETGKPMGREELTAEALTQLIAGSDTTSNSSCAIIYYLSNNPRVMKKLQDELDKAAEEKAHGEEVLHFDYEDVKALPYLQACIDEALRLHSTSAIGLPRQVPEGGATILGEFFPGGTTVSVPAYTIHRDPTVWGEDSEAYRPERWFERDSKLLQSSFIPFSYGPRSCVGRNLASMELSLLISSVVHRYDIEPLEPGKKLATAEGFLRKPLEFNVAMKRRSV
ncbi:hypothetical protein NCC49_003980 [Naganishia albida]|nr:hypothetical protein NCC49_003980 [Naganishia albida]